MVNLNHTKAQYAIFFIFSLFGLLNIEMWEREKKYQLTGDEPHYVVLTESILRYGSFSPISAYMEEFKNKEIFKPGLAPAGSLPDATNAHIFPGPNGGYSFHLPGLPLLVTPAYAIGGVYGIKCFLVIFSAFGAVLLYRLALKWHGQGAALFWTLVFTGSYPYFYFASQIYPESPAAVLILLIFYSGRQIFQERFAGPHRFLHLAAVAFSIALLPWLHSKFAIVALPVGLVVFDRYMRRGWE